MAQRLRPKADISIGPWLDSAGESPTELWPMLDETSPVTGDYVYTETEGAFEVLMDAGRFIVKVPCWNKVSVCPQVASVTIKVFLKVPWIGRANVTRFTLCSQSECSLPAFVALQAKPGEAYRFFYNRMTAAWGEAPSVVTVN